MTQDKKTVLLVDDDQDFLNLLAVKLEKAGYQIQLALDGEDALHKIYNKNPDLIISDIKMPKMNGWDLLKKIHATERTKKIPFIVVSGVDPKHDLVQVDGISAYFVKPVKIEALLEKIKEEISKKSIG